jgi:ribose/xylose/arabinose/galactoside ABC-type transport system permease subunit
VVDVKVLYGVAASVAFALTFLWGAPLQVWAWAGPFVVGISGLFGWIGGELFEALGLGAFLAGLLGLLAARGLVRRLYAAPVRMGNEHGELRLRGEETGPTHEEDAGG